MSTSGTSSSGLRAGSNDDPDRYELRRTVAAGSEGILYEAHRLDGNDGVRVAVKMLHPGHHADFDRWATRWMEQAQLLQHLAAPGLVRVRDAFTGPLPHPEGAPDPTSRSLYLVMDWVEGEPLWAWVEEHPELSAAALLQPLLPVGTALDLLHSGVATGGNVLVHGDLKPSNILIAPSGTVLVDLGAVRMFDAARQSGISGTHGYVAPEVLAEGRWSAASDRYALGCVALALLCGKEPPARATEDQLRSMLEASPRCQQTPEVIDHVMAMLASDPEDRPTNCANWLAQLRGSSIITTSREAELPPLAPGRRPAADPVEREAEPDRRRGRRAVLGAAIALLVVGGSAAVVLSDDEEPIAGPDPSSTSSTSTTVFDPRPAHCVRGTDGALRIREAAAGTETGLGIDEGSCDVHDLTFEAELVRKGGNTWRHIYWQGVEGWVADEWLVPVDPPDEAVEAEGESTTSTTSTEQSDGPTIITTPDTVGPPVLYGIRLGGTRTEGETTYGRIHLVFDRSVRHNAGTEFEFPAVFVHGSDETCQSTTDVVHDVIEGDGTSVLVVEAIIEPGPLFVTVNPGFATDPSTDLGNEAAQCQAASLPPLGQTG